MKKFLALFLATMMCLTVFVACNGGGTDASETTTADTTTDASTTTLGGNEETTTDPTVENETTTESLDDQKVVENFYPETLVTKLKNKLSESPSSFSVYDMNGGPYMIQNEDFITDGKVLALSFPLKETKGTNALDSFMLTVSIFDKSLSSLKTTPAKKVVIHANAEQYELTKNTSYMSWLTLDVSEYNIVLNENQVLAIGASTDTLIPLYTTDSSVEKLIDNEVDGGTGFFSRLGTGSLGVSCHTLIYDVKMERNYTYGSDEYANILAQKAASAATLEAVMAKYAGMQLSIIGDSISTYHGISTNTSHNGTIGNNDYYYAPDRDYLSDSDFTYWGRLLDDLNMELCVNNSWSGGRVFGKQNIGYVDSAIGRASQLHRDNGTRDDLSDDVKPDVIFYYMGINDINNNVVFGDLMQTLSTTADDQKDSVVEAWMTSLLEITQNGTKITYGNSITTFQEAYAISLYNMTQAYPDAEIYLINLLPCYKYFNNNTQSLGATDKLAEMESWNAFYALMADYFDLTVVDQYNDSYMDYDTNIHFYTNATDWLHPNAGGFKRMEELIIHTMAKKNGLI